MQKMFNLREMQIQTIRQYVIPSDGWIPMSDNTK